MTNQPDVPATNEIPVTEKSKVRRIRKTLGLTGVTINAMALIAPGALMWLLYQSQAAGQIGGLADIWPGVLAALLIAVLTSYSLGELSRRFPEAGLRGAYHFADPVFREKEAGRAKWLKSVKLLTGWAAHLYYWMYPGVMVAFTGVLADYLLRHSGYQPTIFGQLILVFSFSAFVGFLALRGISGSTTTSVVLNVLQLVMLLIFSGLGLYFRLANPLGLGAENWSNPDLSSVLLPASLAGLVFQAGLAMVLMVGFEDSSVLGKAAQNPARDIPRATILALLVQGALAYLLEYLVAGLAINDRLPGILQSRIPIGDLVFQMGDVLLAGNGSAALISVALVILIALVGSGLTAFNSGVRTSFSMVFDPDMPSLLSFLRPDQTTPYNTVMLLGGFAAVVGAAGAIGGLGVMMGIIMAANFGAFILYGTLCGLTIVAYAGDAQRDTLRHIVLPGLGLLVNVGVALAYPFIGVASGGVPAQAALVALGIVAAWLLASIASLVVRKHRT